jgi:hypothetical protein
MFTGISRAAIIVAFAFTGFCGSALLGNGQLEVRSGQEVKDTCGKVGGTYMQVGAGYGCVTQGL